MDILLAIIEIVLILGVLISIHEAGHLSMAKAFHVYCFEYSIGFGPAIIHKKRKKGETYFSLRAIPLGGYVSMYDEDGEAPEGYEAPDPSRSLNAIAKWKKCIVLVAGVTLNFVLGLVLIFVSDVAFPQYYSAYSSPYNETSQRTVLYTPATYGEEVASYIEENALEGYEPKDYYVELPANLNNTYIMLSDNVTMSTTSSIFVALYSPSTLLEDHNLADSVVFYPATEEGVTEEMKEMGIYRLPDQKAINSGDSFDVSASPEGTTASFTISLLPVSQQMTMEQSRQNAISLPVTLTATKQGDVVSWGDYGVEFQVIKQWLGWNGAWRKWAGDVPTACGAIVKGFASLFTAEGFNNLSGIVGMTAALPALQASGGAARIFYFAGLLSINLAFFNLLPFPGLDGWALLVTIIEGITRKRVPAKAQSIMSVIGMVLLFGLMIAVTVKDIIQLII